MINYESALRSISDYAPRIAQNQSISRGAFYGYFRCRYKTGFGSRMTESWPNPVNPSLSENDSYTAVFRRSTLEL